MKERMSGNRVKQACVEIRVSAETDLDEATLCGAEYIGLGNEGCVWKVPDTRTLLKFASVAEEKGIRCSLITPIIPQHSCERIFSIVLDAACSGLFERVVFNDYGLLAACADRIHMKECQFVLGRLLLQGLAECPWYEYILRDESSEAKTALLQVPLRLLHDAGVINRLRIQGVEFSQSVASVGNVEMARELNLAVGVHMRSDVLTVGRTCPVARWNRLVPPKCRDLCDECASAKLVKAWLPQYQMLGSVKGPARGFGWSTWVMGNCLISDRVESDRVDSSISSCDYVVLDLRRIRGCAAAEVAQIRRRWRKQSAGCFAV